ncbi:MAG: hypothetical protein ABI640_16845 [Gammaproteobacteria bacterium]
MRKVALLFLAALPLFAACQTKGPLERAGEKADNALGNRNSTGQATGRKVDNAVKDVREGVDDAADDLKKKK